MKKGDGFIPIEEEEDENGELAPQPKKGEEEDEVDEAAMKKKAAIREGLAELVRLFP